MKPQHSTNPRVVREIRHRHARLERAERQEAKRMPRDPSDPVIGTPERLRQPGRAVPITAETPDLVFDLEQLIDRERVLHLGWGSGEAAVMLLNGLAEFGWQVVRLPSAP